MQSGLFYRCRVNSRLVSFEVRARETDILFLADKKLQAKARALILKERGNIKTFISKRKDFLYSLVPLKISVGEFENAPEIVKDMIITSEKAGVGPMAAVAGAMAERVSRGLLRFSRNIIAENGGDIFINTHKDAFVNVYAGASCISGRINIRIRSGRMPVGVCTSSGKVGHSLNFGRADAVTVIAEKAALADAAATRVSNSVKKKEDIKKALRLAKSIEGVAGCVIIYDNKLGMAGEVEIA